MLTEFQVEEKIEDRFRRMVDSEQIAQRSFADEGAILATVKASVLSNFAQFLGEYRDLLPPKDAVLAALDRAIDKAFAALDRPFIASLLKPAAKRLILDAADKMYESIVNPEPRTEV